MTPRRKTPTTTPDREDPCSYVPLMPDGSIYYPSGDVEKNWLLAENIRALIGRTLDPESAERLLVELERLYQQHGIYKPAEWPD